MRVRVNKNSTSFLGLLFIVLLVLKLTELAQLSWLWVFSPFWVPIAFVVVGLAIWFITASINVGIENHAAYKRRKRWQKRQK